MEDFINEVWKIIDSTDGEYQVSNKGRVKSLKYGKERILKPFYSGKIQKNGSRYLTVHLGKSGNTKMVHRLVALAFIPNPENKTQVNHIDGNKNNNDSNNLEWTTNQENMSHAISMGLNGYSGVKNANYKGGISGFDLDGNLVIQFSGVKDIQNKGFCAASVYNCVNGRQKTHKNLTFKRIT
jgi:hypothetical protein